MDYLEFDFLSDDELMHYGTPRHSGRYPWGSGKEPYQHSGDFLSRVEEYRNQKLTYTDENGKTYTGDTAIAKQMGLTSSEFRTQVSLANYERRRLDVDRAKSLKEDGLGATEIGTIMGINESSVRSLLNADSEAKMNSAMKTADFLRNQVNEKGMIEVGAGVERELNISNEKLKTALYILEREGYPTWSGGVQQVTNKGQQTTQKVLCPPDTPHSAIYNLEDIHTITEYASHNGGESFDKFIYPSSMDSKRLKICYGDEKGLDGHYGIEKDGVMEIRRGVDDLSLGNSHYAQVRILVDDNKYLKGMAVYSDNLPDGIDIVFNTNKKSGTPKEKVLKDITNDPDNPFGSAIKANGQSFYDDPNGKYTDPLTGKKQSLSLINKRAEEGDWTDWKDKLPSQFLSKQNLSLAKKQLKLAIDDKAEEYDEIQSLTNPTVKKHLLETFANDCDSAAVHLQAAALPRQKYHVILPLPSMKDTEVYAPNYENGEKVALIRYPHGGTFEIPVLTVNNKISLAKKMFGNMTDAICINSKVAERLSGADFDGDTVMVIPTAGNGKNSKVNIKSTDPLKDLEGFDPKTEYPYKEGMRVMTKHQKGIEMGKASNLITDMTIKGAKSEELARAVKHSMVVIDAEKHKLDWKQSEKDNGIAELKKKYQGEYDENGKLHTSASTIISKASAEVNVPKRKGSPIPDEMRETGKVKYKESGETYVDKNGKTIVRTQKSTQMAETDDAYSLVSSYNTPMERAYADYANTMKAMANTARKEMMSTGKIDYSPSAKETYKTEVSSLNAKLNVSLKNAPKERAAQRIANIEVKAKKQANPDMTKEEEKKISQRALTNARIKVGAKRESIKITDKEWEAIQAGAVSENTLNKIIKNTDIDDLRQRATPRATTTLSTAKINKMASMSASGHTYSEIAKSLGVSPSTVSKYLNGKG